MMGDCKICIDDKSCCHTALEINQSQEIDRLNAQVAILHDVLDKLAKLGNGDRFGNSVGNCMAQDALQKSPSDWLKTRDAKIRDEALNDAAVKVRATLIYRKPYINSKGEEKESVFLPSFDLCRLIADSIFDMKSKP